MHVLCNRTTTVFVSGFVPAVLGESSQRETSDILKILIGELKADEGSVYLTDSYSYISQLDEECKVCDNSKIKKIFNVPNEYEEY